MVWKYEDGYGSPTWEFIMHDADRAARGDRRAALRLLRDLKDCLANEKPIHDELVSYLLVCITKIVDEDSDPEIAFNLVKTRGRPTNAANTEQRQAIFEFITEARDRGETYEAAVEEASVRFNASESKVKRYYSQWGRYLRYYGDGEHVMEFVDWLEDDVNHGFRVIK